MKGIYFASQRTWLSDESRDPRQPPLASHTRRSQNFNHVAVAPETEPTRHVSQYRKLLKSSHVHSWRRREEGDTHTHTHGYLVTCRAGSYAVLVGTIWSDLVSGVRLRLL